ncbi:MAG: patatin family protein [Marinisporobacter sp.]|nr:patatin family protein [Marinisporobacter sp.]
MFLKNIGLVLEGGGMRGAYTSGVLDALMDENIKCSYVIGVSAGANNGADFIAKQRDRNKKVFVDIVGDKRYLGIMNLLKEGSYFGMNFLFDEVPNVLVPFDYETFANNPVTFKVCTTDCEAGQSVYFSHKDYDAKYFVQKILRASCSLPILSLPVEINGSSYLDGGIIDPIPIDQSMKEGNPYNIIVLTRNKNYRKTPSKLNFLTNIFLYKYPKLIKIIKTRYKKYNDCVETINDLESKGYAYVFRPRKELSVDRFEKDISKLNDLYKQGYEETINQMESFKKWMKRIEEGSTNV